MDDTLTLATGENTASPTDGAASDGGSPPLTEQAKQQAQRVVQQTQQRAGEAFGQVQTQLKSRIETRKEDAASGLGTIASAVRATGQHLREQEQTALGSYAESAAEAVENLSGYLRRTDVDEFVGEVENFARRQPAVFLGGVFLLGFLAARFLKSSAPAHGMSGGVPNPDPLLPAPIYHDEAFAPADVTAGSSAAGFGATDPVSPGRMTSDDALSSEYE